MGEYCVKVKGTGSYLPGKPVSNEKLCELFGVDSWILDNLGIHNRYWAIDTETFKLTKTGYQMAAEAGKRALINAKLEANEIDCLILVTAVPDYLMPNSAVLVQEELGIKECNTLEIHAACAGSLQALEIAGNAVQSGKHQNVLICCFNLMSPTSVRELTPERECEIGTLDLLNVCMFGDGAGAMVVSRSDEQGILYVANNSIGVGKEPGMRLLAGGAVYPFSEEVIGKRLDKWQHDANAILKYGRELSQRALSEMLCATGINYADIEHYIFPQANPSMLKEDIENLKKMEGFPAEKIYMNVDKNGNTSTPALFIALDELNMQGKLKEGDLISIVGGEASKWMYGSTLIKW